MKLQAYVTGNPVANSDFWLIKANAIGGPIKVALFFGASDDEFSCLEVAEIYNQKIPRDRYICEAAN